MIKNITIDDVHPRKLYNISETARILGKHRGTIKTYINNGIIQDKVSKLKPKPGSSGRTMHKRGVLGSEIIRVYGSI
ncbi:hypothetical protein [Porphyromonas cangingivalis]|uniref:hypothetical protein n=1 Tax=Porphyromonas cangingivalis TaxID=36874 RepID=UPI0024312DFF|nr:hypothetical protein [Porphyromonas cangingivalis]